MGLSVINWQTARDALIAAARPSLRFQDAAAKPLASLNASGADYDMILSDHEISVATWTGVIQPSLFVEAPDKAPLNLPVVAEHLLGTPVKLVMLGFVHELVPVMIPGTVVVTSTRGVVNSSGVALRQVLRVHYDLSHAIARAQTLTTSFGA